MKLRQAKGNSIITLIQKEASLAVIDNHVKIWQKHLLNGILSRDESPLANLKEMLDWIYSDHAQKNILRLSCR